MRRKREFYREMGFVVLESVLDLRLIEELRSAFERAESGEVPPPWKNLFKAGKFMQLFSPAQLLIPHSRTCWWERIEELGRELTGRSVKVYGDQLFYRPPQCVVGTPLHQDVAFFSDRLREKVHEGYTTGWAPLWDVDSNQSCLKVIPGSHQWGLVNFSVVPNEESPFLAGHTIAEVDETQAIPIPVKAGSVVFFDGLLVHGSGTNEAASPRLSISTHCSVS